MSFKDIPLMPLCADSPNRNKNIDTDHEAQIIELTRKLWTLNTQLKQLQQANDRLELLALTDDVTELGNQRFLYRWLEQEFDCWLRFGNNLSVIMLDLDEFKLLNDTHDHLFGSAVLKRIGELLRRSVGSTSLLARFGGDEFCIILPNTGLEDALEAGERVRSVIATSNLGRPDDRWMTTVSVGVASAVSSKANTPRELLRRADHALYQAKANGRNCVASDSRENGR